MISRIREYSLLAALLCLIATSLWADFCTPRWDLMTRDPADQWPLGAVHGTEPWPLIPRWESTVFAAVVIPPTWVASLLGVNGTAYGMAVGVGQHYPAGMMYSPLPMEAAFEYLRVALPFWFVAVMAIGEAVVWLIQQRKREKAA